MSKIKLTIGGREGEDAIELEDVSLEIASADEVGTGYPIPDLDATFTIALDPKEGDELFKAVNRMSDMHKVVVEYTNFLAAAYVRERGCYPLEIKEERQSDGSLRVWLEEAFPESREVVPLTTLIGTGAAACAYRAMTEIRPWDVVMVFRPSDDEARLFEAIEFVSKALLCVEKPN